MCDELRPFCKACDSEMVLREGAYGKFWACPKSYEGNNHGTLTYAPSKQRKRRILFFEDDTSPSWGVDHMGN